MGDKIVLDLNQRERDRFIGQLAGLSELAQRGVAALETQEDADFFAVMLLLGASVSTLLPDLLPVFQAAQTVNTDDLDQRPFGFGPDGDGTDGG